MKITKSQIEDRRAQLVAQADQHLANFNACQGGIEDCDYWLSVDDESEATSLKRKTKG